MKYLMKILWDWEVRCFGIDHAKNIPIRALRTVEEAIELAQACDVPREAVLRCVNIVYDKPVGDLQQELGGTLLTTYALCEALGVNPEEIFVTELRRVLEKSPLHFSDRNAEKIKLGLDAGPIGEPLRERDMPTRLRSIGDGESFM